MCNVVKLTKVTQLTSTLSALYYFDTGTTFKPYIGSDSIVIATVYDDRVVYSVILGYKFEEL